MIRNNIDTLKGTRATESASYGESFLAGLDFIFPNNNKRRLPYRILVIGDGGSGKTRLVENILRGRRIAMWPQRAATTKKVEEIQGQVDDIYIDVLDTPGQRQFFHILENRALGLIGTGEIGGIINVTCWGHNETSRPSGTLRNVDDSGPPPYFDNTDKINYTRIRHLISSEFEFMRRWTSLVPFGSQIRWIITAVNKADLLPDGGRVATSYYEKSGEYGKALLNSFSEHTRYQVSLTSADPGRYYQKEPKVNEQLTDNQIANANSNFKKTLLSCIEMELENA